MLRPPARTAVERQGPSRSVPEAECDFVIMRTHRRPEPPTRRTWVNTEEDAADKAPTGSTVQPDGGIAAAEGFWGPHSVNSEGLTPDVQ
jgi:hypothetical protein